MRPQPYIGITGFTHRDQVNAVVNALPVDTDRLVMAGLLVSNRTLRGETNKWPNRYPRPEQLKDIFPRYNCLLNLIHFNTKEPENLLDDMIRAQDMVGPNCDGFQLNMVWPDPKVLEQYKKTEFRNRTVVLQVGSKAMEKVAHTPLLLAHQIERYEGVIDYALIDPSGGYGQDFDVKLAEDFFFELNRIVPWVGMGIAGGLQPANLDRLRPLLSMYEFSIDAEGKLRDKDDHLDLATAVTYLRTADQLYRTFKRAA